MDAVEHLPELPLRLDTLLRARAHLDRKSAGAAVAAGEVSVGGTDRAALSSAGMLVFPDEPVFYRGSELCSRMPNGYWMLHKPMGVVCARRGAELPNLSQWLEDLQLGTIAIGRLDKATTGLLFLTTDGDLTYLLTHPQHHAAKIYLLTVFGAVDDSDHRLEALRQGVELPDGIARSTGVRVAFRSERLSRIEVEVREGRNRMVRRMARAANLHLLHLHRVSVGPVGMGELACGDRRRLTPDEVAALYACAGGLKSAWVCRANALHRTARKHREQGTSDARLEAWLAKHWQL